MEYIIVLLLGVILGVGVVFLLRPQLFVGRGQDFSMLEAMYDQMVEDLEEREQRLHVQIEEWERRIREARSTDKGFSSNRPTGSPMPVEAGEGDRVSQSSKVGAVAELLEQGCEPLAVAKRLGIGRGEVELIMRLREPKK